MISRRLAGVVLGVSIIGGIAVGVAATAMTSDHPTAATPTRTPVAEPLPDVEVKKPVLVMNDDGGATLSATLVNHTKTALKIIWATAGQPGAHDTPVLLVHGSQSGVEIEPGESMRIGGVGDRFRVRFADRVQVGATLPVTIVFDHGNARGDGPRATLLAPVVARSTVYSAVANNGPNDAITVHEGKIVVVPGQEKAYLGGWMESSIDDMTVVRPTAVGPGGLPVEVLHQTASGGPFAFSARTDQKSFLGYSPYLDDGGEREYVHAREVKVGRAIRVTIRFPSGDVVGKFEVVQGKADGTI